MHFFLKMDEKLKNIYICTGFTFPGMSKKELDNVINERGSTCRRHK
jgi:hypothetical protein